MDFPVEVTILNTNISLPQTFSWGFIVCRRNTCSSLCGYITLADISSHQLPCNNLICRKPSSYDKLLSNNEDLNAVNHGCSWLLQWFKVGTWPNTSIVFTGKILRDPSVDFYVVLLIGSLKQPEFILLLIASEKVMVNQLLQSFLALWQMFFHSAMKCGLLLSWQNNIWWATNMASKTCFISLSLHGLMWCHVWDMFLGKHLQVAAVHHVDGTIYCDNHAHVMIWDDECFMSVLLDRLPFEWTAMDVTYIMFIQGSREYFISEGKALWMRRFIRCCRICILWSALIA